MHIIVTIVYYVMYNMIYVYCSIVCEYIYIYIYIYIYMYIHIHIHTYVYIYIYIYIYIHIHIHTCAENTTRSDF